MRIRYAQVLLRLVECQFAQSKRGTVEQLASLAAVGASPSHLRRRIAVLLGEPLREPLRISRAGLMTLMFLSVVLFLAPAIVVSSGQEAAEKKPVNESESLPEKATSKRTESPVDGRVSKKHSSGVEVELLAIGTRGEPAQRWWRPNGALLDGEPYHVKDFERYSFPGPLTREVVFTLENFPEEAGWKCRTRPQGASMGTGGVADAEGNRLRHHHALISSLPDNAASFGFEVGVAAGEWKTVATYDLPSGKTSRANGGAVFAGPYVSLGGRAVLTVSHRLEEQVRLVTVYKGGVRSPELAWVQHGAGESILVSQFELRSQDQIERVEFQSRPYEWVVFDNLPTQPGDSHIDAERAAAPAVKVLAIGYGDAVDKPASRWWNADGTPREAPQSQFNGQRNPQMLSDPRARQIVIELLDYHPGSAVRFEIKSKSGWSRGELSASELDAPKGQPKVLHEVHTIADDDEVFTLRVGRADGEWKTVYSGDAGAVAQGNKELKGVVFSGAFAQGAGSAVVVSHNWHGQNTRLIAIDNSGKRHTGKFSAQLAAAETVNQTIFEFADMKPDGIAEFDIQVQDFAWTTIDDLPANPKPPADAKATISGRIKLADGSPATEPGTLYYHLSPRDNPTISGIAGQVGRVKDHYSFEVPAGTLWLAHFTEQHAPAVVGFLEVETGERLSDVDLVLEPGLNAKVKFEDEDHEPISGAQLTMVPCVGEDTFGQAIAHAGSSDGSLVVPHVAENAAYRLIVRAPGHQPFHMTPVQWSAASRSPFPLTMRKSRPATGRLLRPDGSPAVDAILKTRVGVSGRHIVDEFKPKDVQVDVEGRYSMDELIDRVHYLVLAETTDGGRVILPPVVAGQEGLLVKIPDRPVVKIRVIGDLKKLNDQQQGGPLLRVRQHYEFKPAVGTELRDTISEDVPVETTDAGGMAVYRGLIDAPIEIIAGGKTYEFDGSESEVTINLDEPNKILYQNRY